MIKYIILLGVISIGSCEWVRRARLVEPNEYFIELMQETVYELERREWCNLVLLDMEQTLNEQMYDWLVSGTVTYKNGFVVGIQKIDVTDISTVFSERNDTNNVTHVYARVQGLLNLRNAKIGYEVLANLNNEGIQHYTGTFLHDSIRLSCLVEKNFHLETIATSCSVSSMANGGNGLMTYLPANEVTEVLSRRYSGSDIWNGVVIWGRDIIAPIMLDVATNKVPFPQVCFNEC